MSAPWHADLTWVTRAYLGLLASRLALYVGWLVLHPRSARLDAILGGAQVVGLVVGVVLGLVWLVRAWVRVPEPCRRAYDGRRVKPEEALWKLFIPIYGIYWLFIANIGLCGAVERHLRRGRARSTEAPSTLALIACLVQLVPVVNVGVAPFLWGAFMARVDHTQAEAERLDPDGPRAEPVRWLKLVVTVAGWVLFGQVAAVLLFLAIWQFLNPGGPPPRP